MRPYGKIVTFSVKAAEAIKNKFRVESKSSVLQIHWDGKLLPDLEDIHHLVYRLAITVSGKNIDQILGIPKLERGTGVAMSESIVQMLNDWEIGFNLVCGLVFDTTSSNTGTTSACILLEEQLDQKLLYLACRHHIYEIFLRAAWEHLMGKTSGPKVPLFDRFQKAWKGINKQNFIRAVDEPEISARIQDDEVLAFALRRLQVKLREFIQFQNAKK